MKNQAEPRIKARCKRCTIIVPVASKRGLQFLCGKCLLDPDRLSMPGIKRTNAAPG